MFATNIAATGAGLAAPQIGVDRAAFVFDCVDADLRRQVGVVCNPAVEVREGRDRHLKTWDEGCLSLPGGYAELARPDPAICRGQDRYGDLIELTGTGQLARCFEHETDHLNGMVFGDRLSAGAATASTKATAGSLTAIPPTGPSRPINPAEARRRASGWPSSRGTGHRVGVAGGWGRWPDTRRAALRRPGLSLPLTVDCRGRPPASPPGPFGLKCEIGVGQFPRHSLARRSPLFAHDRSNQLVDQPS